MDTSALARFWRPLPWLAALLLLCAAPFAAAQEAVDPPARVGHVSEREGSVVFSPEGEEEWVELPQNRPLTTGDRLWTDQGARAELHLGPATLHIDGESHLGVSALDDRAAQFILMQGTVQARVRELAPGENFEIDTPNLALRATEPGEVRLDVAADGSSTRVVVHGGAVQVYGDGGQAMQLQAGQQASFAGRGLHQVQGVAFQADAFGQWAAARNQAEDQSIAARHVPRGVVGYSQLDQHGSWGQDPNHGAVWYPRVEVADWAPYRYGSWTWVDPWGWTWVDDAPWGFAPFHYGRWAMIGSRWAWVPGRMVERPVYSPALVSFLGGAGGVSFHVGGGPGVGWIPLAPGEAWWPSYRTSSRYVGFANFNIDLRRYPRHWDRHFHRRHPHAVTAVREDDFRRGRPVRQGWRALPRSAFDHGRIGTAPARPGFGDRRSQRATFGERPRLRVAPPLARAAQPDRFWGADRDGAWRGREQREHRFGSPRVQQEQGWPAPRMREQPGRDPAVRQQQRAQRQQEQLQRDAVRAHRQQQREAVQREPRAPRFMPPQVRQPQLREQQAAPIAREPRQRFERPHRQERHERVEQRRERREGRGQERRQRNDDRPGRGGGRGGDGPWGRG